MIVATAGHIDHGKTALVKTLTGVDTDRLPEEKARGISIDLGFANWTPEPLQQIPAISFVDVPGHERFIRNMLAGVCAIDYLMLVVAADDGPMPQTVEHLQIIDLLGISQGVVVITKTDRVPAARVSEVSDTMRALVAPTGLGGAGLIAVSAHDGTGIDQLRAHLGAASRAHVNRVQAGQHFRHVIDRAFTIAGSGTVVTGTIVAGQVSVGDHLTLSPAGTEVRVRAIQRHGQSQGSAHAGERCALNLAGIGHSQVSRGDWLLAPAMFCPTRRIEARIRLPREETRALSHWTPLQVHIGAAVVPARVCMRRAASIEPGETAVVQLRLDRDISAFHGDRFVLRDHGATRTIGGGVVIDPYPAPRSVPGARSQALSAPSPEQSLVALLDTGLPGVDLSWFSRVFNLTDQALEQVVKHSGAQVLGREHRFAFAPATLAALGTQLVQALTAFHRTHPQANGMDAEALCKQVARHLDRQVFAAFVRELVQAAKVEMAGAQLRVAQHDATDNPRDKRTWETLQPMLMQAGSNIPMVRELARLSGIAEHSLRDFLHRKSRGSQLVRLTPERFALQTTIAALANEARHTSAQVAGGAFTAAQFRDRIGTGRGLAIEILECLDRLGITRRAGNTRTCAPAEPGQAAATAAMQAATAAKPATAASRPASRSEKDQAA